MTQGTTGAASSARLQTVLDAGFVENLEALTTEDIRGRRDEALAEREYLSYLRRLLQVRQDVLVAERDRRAAGGQSKPVVERLTEVLAEGPQSRGRGEALRLSLTDADMAEAERRVDSVLGGAIISNVETLPDEELTRALEALDAEERRVSVDRTEVLRVHDRLQEELKRRYREDPSQIPREI